MRRLPVSAIAAAFVALLGCGAVASGAPDRAAAEAARFEDTMTRVEAWMNQAHDERGTVYEHWRILRAGAVSTAVDREIDYARMGGVNGSGRDTAVWSRDRKARPGYSVDTIHVPGSDVDLLLLGDRYLQQIPGVPPATRWMSRRTTLLPTWSPCTNDALMRFCWLNDAFRRSKAAVPGLPLEYRERADGVITARTGIRLIDLVTYNVVRLDATTLAHLVTELETLIPFTLTIDPDGTFRSVELNGQITAADITLDVQVGVEHLGGATAADFPRSPAASEPIHAMDALEYVFFRDALTQINTDEQSSGRPTGG